MSKRFSRWLKKKRKGDTAPALPVNKPEPATTKPTVPPPNDSLSSASTTQVKARDLWEAAFNKLNVDDQRILRSSSNNRQPQSILDGIIETTKGQYEKYKSGSWKIKISQGDFVDIRESAFKVINAALSFKDVIGAAVAFDPTGHASSSWSIVSIGLTTTKNHHDARLAVLQSSEFLADLLARWAIMESAYRDKPKKELQWKEGVENAITHVYIAILCYAAQVLTEQQAGNGTHIMRSFTALTDQPLTSLKSAISTQEEKLRQWIEIDQHIRRKEEAENILSQIDELVKAVDNLSKDLGLSKLKFAEGASYDSYANQHEQFCLEDTRTDLFQHIMHWAESPSGKLIFWLNGMAGTGKSTLSRTVAKSFRDKGILGASFFFKKGEIDRQSAARFFPTIIRQLISQEHRLVPYVRSAIESGPDLATKSLSEQFDRLPLQPLLGINGQISSRRASSLVIVIDALDECEESKDIRVILQLLPRAMDLSSNSPLIKLFVTSRPELPIMTGFTRMADEEHQDFILHEVAEETVSQDISRFVHHMFDVIRWDNPTISRSWPGNDILQQIVSRSVPLFIFASTICRFVADDAWDPEERLNEVLSSFQSEKSTHSDMLHDTYRPILDHLLLQISDLEREIIIAEFREIIGSIIILSRPLAISVLAKLLSVPESRVKTRLKSLHSVLYIPEQEEMPVRLLHLSFRDFLLDLDARDRNLFWVDEEAAHRKLLSQCLQIMSHPVNGLRRNICNLPFDGMELINIKPEVVQDHISEELAYACQNWVYNLQKGDIVITDHQEVHSFLQLGLLWWLEAMALLDSTSESMRDIEMLQSSIQAENGHSVTEFLYDAKRFVLENRTMIDIAPLQLYSAALLFAPLSSVVANGFKDQIPDWVSYRPSTRQEWGPLIQTLEGHSEMITALAFDPTGKRLASGSIDGIVNLWDVATGALKLTLDGHTNFITGIAFSVKGYLATGSHDYTAKLWDPELGIVTQTLTDHRSIVGCVAFSHEGDLLAYGSHYRGIKLWDVAKGTLRCTIELDGIIAGVAFSADDHQIAVYTDEQDITVFDSTTGTLLKSLHTCFKPQSIAFFPDSSKVAVGLESGHAEIWDTAAGNMINTVLSGTQWVINVTISKDSKLLMCLSKDRTLETYDVATGRVLKTFNTHHHFADGEVSSDMRLIASFLGNVISLWDTTLEMQSPLSMNKDSNETTKASPLELAPNAHRLAVAYLRSETFQVELWDPVVGTFQASLEQAILRDIDQIIFSPDSRYLTIRHFAKTMQVWDAMTGRLHTALKGHETFVSSMAFSPDSSTIASASANRTIRLWRSSSGDLVHTLTDNSDLVEILTFAACSCRLASGSRDGTITLWNTIFGIQEYTLQHHTDIISRLKFSPDGILLASGSFDDTITLWDAAIGVHRKTLTGHSTSVKSLAFSPDNTLLASGSSSDTLRIWDVAKGTYLYSIYLLGRGDVVEFRTNDVLRSTGGDFRLLPSSCVPCGIFISDEWLTIGAHNVLWFPSQYRPRLWQLNGDSSMCSVDESGRLSFWHFNIPPHCESIHDIKSQYN